MLIEQKYIPRNLLLCVLLALHIPPLMGCHQMDDDLPDAAMQLAMPFHEQWQRKHEAWDVDGWSDKGFDSSVSKWPRDVQLFTAMKYGTSDIENGGFHQFFGNSTGALAPEMVEFCNRSGLDDVATILTEAMAMLGSPYPVDQRSRQASLAILVDRHPDEKLDPLSLLDERFYDILSRNGSRFDDAANSWLRDVCSVRSLDDLPTGG